MQHHIIAISLILLFTPNRARSFLICLHLLPDGPTGDDPATPASFPSPCTVAAERDPAGTKWMMTTMCFNKFLLVTMSPRPNIMLSSEVLPGTILDTNKFLGTICLT